MTTTLPYYRTHYLTIAITTIYTFNGHCYLTIAMTYTIVLHYLTRYRWE